jgi:hypothetical protein
MTEIEHGASRFNAPRRDRLPNRRCAMRAFAWDPDGTERRAAIYAARFHALRHEIALNWRLLDDPRNAERRELLVMRLDETQARAADVHARMIEARTA